MKVQMETLRVGSCISHSWNKMANKKSVIMMLHHLTQLRGLGHLPACQTREREKEKAEREIPPMNNGTCTFMSVVCLRVNFENVRSVCHLPLLLPPPLIFLHHLLPPPPPPPFPSAVYLAAVDCGACCDCPSLSYCCAVSKPRHHWRPTAEQHHLVFSHPARLLWASLRPVHWCRLKRAPSVCLW